LYVSSKHATCINKILKGQAHPDIQSPVLAYLDKSGPGGEPLMIVKIFQTTYFILIFNILIRVMQKALQ
jgi:hypothetical protein